jgi:hypothetical protein
VDLDQALDEFDRVETNLTRLEKVRGQLKQLMPTDPHAMALEPSEQVPYDALRHAFDDLSSVHAPSYESGRHRHASKQSSRRATPSRARCASWPASAGWQ